MKWIFAAALAALATLGLGDVAQAEGAKWCGTSVGFLTQMKYPINALARRNETLYTLYLTDKTGGSRDGYFVILTAKSAYQVLFTDARMQKRRDYFGAAPILFYLPNGEQISASWVAMVGDHNGLLRDCRIADPFVLGDPDYPPTLDLSGVTGLYDEEIARGNFTSLQLGRAQKVADLDQAPATCEHPNRRARTIAAVIPKAPTPLAGTRGTVDVRVSLSEQNQIVGTEVFHSSGNAGLDQLALDAARNSTFATNVFQCKPIPGDYIYRVEFQ